MSRILKNKKKIVLIAGMAVGIALMSVILDFSRLIFLGLEFIWFVYCGITEYLHHKYRKLVSVFGAQSNIRNIDYLVISDMCNVEDFIPAQSTYIQIAVPGRGENSAFEILKHTHSILKENGTVVIAVNKRNKRFSIFDVPFLHRITIKKYRLERLCMMYKNPLFFAPIASLKILFGGGRSAYNIERNIDNKVGSFCHERGYELIYLEKK